ncbi:MAG: L-threonylcarbamoyladenylate synthase [Salinibacter sp.]
MDTHLTTSPEEAARYIDQGHLAAFPTETVYGLGADAFQPDAVQSIFEAKGRPADNPLIVHLGARVQVRQVAAAVPPVAETLLDRFAPGPLTLILPKAEGVPGAVTADLDTIGVRLPVHDGARAFLRACDTPVAAPSANRSGRPSPTHWRAVQEDLGGRIACILKGGRTEAGVESTVLDCTSPRPTVLRPGAVSVEALRETIGEGVLSSAPEPESPRSPGTKHRHYAPAAQVRLVRAPAAAEPGPTAAYIGLQAPARAASFRMCRVADDVEAYARELFRFFRACDRADCSVIYAQTATPEGLGRALNDRLERAAAR